MICNRCGKEISEGQLFCSNCGYEIRLVAEYDMTDDLIVKPQIDNVTQADKNTDADIAELESTDKINLHFKYRNRKRLFLIILSALAFSILLFVFAVIYINDNSFDYQMKKAKQLYDDAEYEEALKSVNKAIKLDDQNALALLLAADCYDAVNKDAEAGQMYILAIKNAPSNIDCYRKLFAFLQQNEDYDKIKDFIDSSSIRNELIKEFPDFYPLTPVIDKESGLYNEQLVVTFDTDSVNDIFYTLDGSEPNIESFRYAKPIVLDKEGNYTLKAVSKNAKNVLSDIAIRNYEIVFPIPDSPAVTPGTGRYTDDTLIKIMTDENCKAYYTWDGSIPTTKSKVYNLPIKMKDGSHTFTAISVNEYGKISEPTVRSFDVYLNDEDEQHNIIKKFVR